MNLSLFRKVSDSKVEEYRQTATVLSKNFYALLLSKVGVLLKRNEANKSADATLESKVLGNDLLFKKQGTNVSLYVNKVKAASVSVGKNAAVELILKTVTSEIEGVIDVKRPDGRKLSSDRAELSPNSLVKKDLSFPKQIYSLMTKSTTTGEKQSSVLKTKKNQSFLSESDYKFLSKEGAINPSDYEKHGKGYVKGSEKVFVYNGPLSPYNFNEFVARSGLKGLEKYTDLHRHTYILSNNVLYEYNSTNDIVKKQ